MSETKKVNTAPIKWAQRSDSLYITIALPGERTIIVSTLRTALNQYQLFCLYQY